MKLVSTLKLSMINRMACPVHHFNEHMDFKRTSHAQGRKLINYWIKEPFERLIWEKIALTSDSGRMDHCWVRQGFSETHKQLNRKNCIVSDWYNPSWDNARFFSSLERGTKRPIPVADHFSILTSKLPPSIHILSPWKMILLTFTIQFNTFNFIIYCT